jgi:hypothetical protein
MSRSSCPSPVDKKPKHYEFNADALVTAPPVLGTPRVGLVFYDLTLEQLKIIDRWRAGRTRFAPAQELAKSLIDKRWPGGPPSQGELSNAYLVGEITQDHAAENQHLQRLKAKPLRPLSATSILRAAGRVSPVYPKR